MKSLCIAILVVFLSYSAYSQTTAFTYQGRLNDGPNSANGTYLLKFSLFDSASAGSQVGSTISDVEAVAVNGIFTIELDFGEAVFFGGQDLYVEIAVRRNVGESYVTLTPRQPLASAPYAVKSRLAQDAFDSYRLGGVDAFRYIKDDNSALSDARDPLPGSGSYIQNGSSEQPSSEFNISGSGKAASFDAASHFSVGGTQILRTEANGTLKVGSEAGTNNTGASNTFVGSSAGQNNPAGFENSFFGAQAGMNTATARNSFFGFSSGKATNSGSNNSFFGHESGVSNLDGDANSFVGRSAGSGNTSGDQNTFVGAFSGVVNTTGSGITLLGTLTDVPLGSNLVNATAIGANAVVAQSNSVVLGSNANVGIGTSTPQSKLTVVGLIETTTGGVKFPDGTTQTSAFATTSAIFNQTLQQTGNFNISGTGIANVLRAESQFNIGTNRVLAVAGTRNLFLGIEAGPINAATDNTFIGAEAGNDNVTGGDNTFVGSRAGGQTLGGGQNVFLGSVAGFSNISGSQNVSVGDSSNSGNTSSVNSTSVGFQAGQFAAGSSNSFFGASAGRSSSGTGNVYIGSNAATSITGSSNTAVGTASGGASVNADNATLVGYGANLGASSLQYATAIGSGSVVSTSNTIALGRSDGSDKVRVFGLGSAGLTSLCRNASNEIATCSSSLRYKENIEKFYGGLEMIRRFRPIIFDWKQSGVRDVGLGAEDVADISELLVHRNNDGEVEGVKYDRITLVLINAVKEQQAQIAELRSKVEELRKRQGNRK